MSTYSVTPEDIASLIRDKYDGNKNADLEEDLERLASGAPFLFSWMSVPSPPASRWPT